MASDASELPPAGTVQEEEEVPPATPSAADGPHERVLETPRILGRSDSEASVGKPVDFPFALASTLAPVPKLSSAIDTWQAAAPEVAANAEAADAAAPSFERDMWERFNHVWKERIEPSQAVLERFTAVLRSRAELERKYGESLTSFNCDVKLQPQVNSTHAAVDAVMVNFRNRGEQAMELAEQIDQDIVSSLEVVIEQHRDVSRRIYKDAQLLSKYCQEQRFVHEKLARRYCSRSLEAEIIGQACIQGLAVKTTDRLKISQRAVVLSKSAREAEHEYYNSISQLNKAQALYAKHMPSILAALQDLEEKRGKCLKDCLMKLAVYETSWLRNLQYDLEATVKSAEAADISKDLESFIKQSKEQTPARERTAEVAPLSFWMCGKNKEPPKLTPAAKQQVDAQASMITMIRQLMEKEIQPWLHALFVEEATAQSVNDVKEQLEQVRAGLGDIRRRAGFCQCLRQEVLEREAADVEIEKAKGFSMATPAFEALTSLTKSALDACEEQGDTWCGRDIMVIVNLIRSEADTGKTISLLSRVYNHALWNKVTFWEELLLLGLCEAYSSEAVQRRTLPAGCHFTQPAMTAFLQRFLGYMMAFGISFEQGRNSVWTTLRKNQGLLGTTCRPYASLLMEAYEPAPAAAGAGGSPAATGAAGSIGKGDADGAAAAAAALPEPPQVASLPACGGEDDFEAIAMGLPPRESSIDAGVFESEAEHEAGDDKPQEEEVPPMNTKDAEEEQSGAAPEEG